MIKIKGYVRILTILAFFINISHCQQTTDFSLGEQEEHPRVEADREMLCFDYNTVDGVCHAYGTSVIFKQDTAYIRNDLKGIIFQETQIKCKTRSGNPCSLTFTLTNGGNMTTLSLLDHSMIHA